MSVQQAQEWAVRDDADRPDRSGDHRPDHGRTVAGTVVPQVVRTGHADHRDGPGTAVVVPGPREVRTVTGAAFVAARTVGTVVLWTSRGVWTVARCTSHGARATAFLAYRYVRTHDEIEARGGITSAADSRAVKEERRARWKVIGRSALGVLGVDLAAWYELATRTGLHAVQWQAWGTAPGVEGVLTLACLAAYGRYRMVRQLGPTDLVDQADMDEDDDEPFPLSHAVRAEEAEECLSRAMFAEKLGARQILVRQRFTWGWELRVLLRGTTAGKVSAAAPALEAHMNLPTGGFTIETDPQASAEITVRARVGDPFADMPRPAVHPPNSLSVHDVIDMGRAMDGGRLDITLDGFFALVVGAMGAGKTLGALRTLAEAVTACRDAVAWDLDPIKDGLSEFGDLMERRGRGPQECEELLLRARDYVRARARVFRGLGMGDRWQASPEHPALFVFVDEVTLLTDDAKAALVEVVRTGRQLGVWVVIAGQEATEDALGDAIGSIVAYRILLACRPEDTRICFGPGAAALGWTPHRLTPSAGVLANDAGVSFIRGGRFVRPIPYRFHAYGIEQIRACVAGRVAAGRPRLDADTRRAAGEDVAADGRDVTLPELLDAAGGRDAALLADVLRVFAEEHEAFLPTGFLMEAVAQSGHVTPDGRPVDGDWLGRVLRAHAPGVTGVRQPWDGRAQVRGWLAADVERAGRGLLDPSSARLAAG